MAHVMCICSLSDCFSNQRSCILTAKGTDAITGAPRQSRVAIRLRTFPGRFLSDADAPGLRISRFQRAREPSCQGNAMAASNQNEKSEKALQVQAILRDSPSKNGWDECWKEGVTPWDVGSVTPVIQDLVEKGALPNGRALVPGCGSGHDVLALATEFRQVIGLDISETVNRAAKQIAAESPKGTWVEFLVTDFFYYAPEAPFNVIFDYTFFCAIDPVLRPAWAAKMAELLTPDGELITLMFPLAEYDGGPPYAVSIKAYEEVLNPHGFTMISCKENKLAVTGRKGREKIAHWVRNLAGSKI